MSVEAGGYEPDQIDEATREKAALIAEQQARVAQGDFPGAVSLLYEDVLGREVDGDGLSSYSAQLEQGTPLGEVRHTLATSEEFRDRVTAMADADREQAVGTVFLSVLGRSLDDSGRAAYVANSSIPMADVVGNVVGSDEFRDRFLAPVSPADTPAPTHLISPEAPTEPTGASQSRRKERVTRAVETVLVRFPKLRRVVPKGLQQPPPPAA